MQRLQLVLPAHQELALASLVPQVLAQQGRAGRGPRTLPFRQLSGEKGIGRGIGGDESSITCPSKEGCEVNLGIRL